MSDTGLRLGAGTCLIRFAEGRPAVAADLHRCRALLSVLYRRPVASEDLAPIEKAAAYWARGEKALANLHLVFAAMPSLTGPDDAYRLQAAEYLLDHGMTPRDLLQELELCTAADEFGKYDPDQPRVPAGTGRESGRWTSVPHDELLRERENSSPAAGDMPIHLVASADDPQGLKAAKAAARAAGLTTKDERRAFHDLITGQGITNFQDLVEAAKSVKRPPELIHSAYSRKLLR